MLGFGSRHLLLLSLSVAVWFLLWFCCEVCLCVPREEPLYFLDNTVGKLVQ